MVGTSVRIVHVYKDYAPVVGGIENHLSTLAEGQAARGLDVTVLVTSSSGRGSVERRNGVRVVKTSRLATIASTPLSLEFLVALARLEADLIHVHSPYPPGEVGAHLLRRKTPLVVTYHSDVVRQRLLLRCYRGMLRRVLCRADGIIASSAGYVASSPFLREVADRCRVIPHGINAQRFRRTEPRAAAELRRRHGGPLVLFVGRLRYYKGLRYLLEAMTRLDARLLVVGSGPMERPWRALAGRLGLGERVVFVGDVEDVDLPAYYAACDVFVLPASHRSEAFGLVQLEAMAASRPVVSTELGTGTSAVNVDGETGLVVPPRDADALARAISALLGDPGRRTRMGAAGCRRAEAEFSIERMVEQTVRLYDEVMQRAAAAPPRASP